MVDRFTEMMGGLNASASQGWRGGWLPATLVLSVLLSAGQVEAGAVEGECFCDEREAIPISQLIGAVNVAVGTISCPLLPSQSGESPAGKCFCGDGGSIAISQLIRAVNVALGVQPCSLGAFIGPAGGVLAVEDSRNPIAGTKIVVPAGAIAGGAITLTPRTDSDASLPPGLVGLGFGFDVASEAPLSSEIEICFPVHSTERRNDHILSGLFFDATQGNWEVALPGTVDATQFSVRTRQLGLWRPGVTLVREVEDPLLFESVETVAGPEPFSQFQTGVSDFIRPYVSQFTSIDTWKSCSAVTGLIDALTADRTQARELDLSNIAPQCGACSVTSEKFRDEVVELARVKISSQVTDLTITLLDLDFAAASTLQLWAYSYYDNRISALSCDYECFLESNPSAFWLNVGKAYAAEFGVAAAEYVATQIACE